MSLVLVTQGCCIKVVTVASYLVLQYHYNFIYMLILDFGKKKQIIPQSPELSFINTLKKNGNKRRKEMMSKPV